MGLLLPDNADADADDEVHDVHAHLRHALLVEVVGGVAGVARLDARLKLINGKRRARLLELEHVMYAVNNALKQGWYCAIGGKISKGLHKNYGGITTLALAVRLADDSVAVDIAAVQAFRPTPALAWQNLRPWKFEGPPDLDKLLAWAEARRPYPLEKSDGR